MSKTSDLTELTSLDAADFFMVVDASDTSMAPTGRNKKILASNVVSNNLLDTVTDPGTGYFDFTVPAGLNWLEVRGQARNTQLGGVFKVELNGDTTEANYAAEMIRAGDGNVTGSESAAQNRCGYVSGSTMAAQYAGQVFVRMENISGTTFYKNVHSEWNCFDDNDTQYQGSYGVIWKNTAAITSIRITPLTGGDILTGTLRLYGGV